MLFTSIVLLLVIFYYQTNSVYALNLEIQYPTISNQSITSTTSLPEYAKYLFNLGMFVGFFSVFFSLTWASIMFFLSPVNMELKTNARDRFSGAISGLLILALLYLVITTINPQLSVFGSNDPAPVPPPPPAKAAPGVYFYKSACPTGSGAFGAPCTSNNDCSVGLECNLRSKKCTTMVANTSSVYDLDTLKNKVQAVGIIQDPNDNSYFLSILYGNTNLWGQCQYMDPNEECQSGSGGQALTFAASASIHKVDKNPNGDGVYFYRKTCFAKTQLGNIGGFVDYCNKNGGGYYNVTNECIKNGTGCSAEGEDGNSFYVVKLEKLSFTGSESSECTTPVEEQNCVKYNEDGSCGDIHGADDCGDSICEENHNGANGCRCCPSLGGENISSLVINGDYLVLFVYLDTSDGKLNLSSCQEFPNNGDVNKFGPQQMKWENIRNSGGVIPNYAIIFPIKKEQ